MDAFKESVYGLLGEEEEEGLFGKDTFVLSPEDLEILNNDVQRQILDEEEDLFDDSHEEEKIQKSTGEQHKLKLGGSREDPEEVKGSKRFKSVDPDAEYDQTHFLYDPPTKYKNRFILFLTPLLIVALLSWYVYDKFNDQPISPMMSHKLYVLEQDVSSLKHLTMLKDRVTNLEKQLSELRESFQSYNTLVPKNHCLSNEKIESIHTTQDQYPASIQAVTPLPIGSSSSLASTLHPSLSLLQQPHSLKYYNVIPKCQLHRYLTTFPPLPRRRKSVLSRIIHGFPDFLKRSINPPSTNTIDGIKLLSSTNNPRNVLSESAAFWQNPMSEPIYFTITIPDPIHVHEVGIYHSRQPPIATKSRWFKAAPQNVELLIRPVPSDYENVLSIFSHLNQDIKLNLKIKNEKDAKGWIRAGSMKYDIHQNRAYQPFVWSTETRDALSGFYIQNIMFVIYTNWGDEMLALDTVRVYEAVERDSDSGVDDSEVPYLGEM